MKDLLKKPVTFEKIEFWAATVIFVFAVFILLGYASNMENNLWNAPERNMFENNNVPYSFIKYYFLPQLCQYLFYYGAYVLLTFVVIRELVVKQNIALGLILLLCIYVVMASVFGITDTWMKAYLLHSHSERYVYHLVFKQEFISISWLFLVFGLYSFVKNIILTGITNFEELFPNHTSLMRDCAIAIGLWLLSMFFLMIVRAEWQVIFIWSEVVLFSIFLYWYSAETIIPKVINEGREFSVYLGKLLGVLVLSLFPVAILFFVIFNKRAEASLIVNLVNIGVSLFIVAPVSWAIFKSRLKKSVEIQGLKTALGSSNANLDFLRSQINPHFLFNALNTLYGTSLQENAERTGEGIQKLGDMMRFMLQENMQEKISLAREVDYLNNYIDLQKLRTQISPDIHIQTVIDEQINGLNIAPMLLIPFVENAFKHGISLREPSHIKISLQTKGNELFFDVYNSIHEKAGTDPERDKSGIGLENVKQRLQLLYPKRHELVVRESAREFFIHLTIQLS